MAHVACSIALQPSPVMRCRMFPPLKNRSVGSSVICRILIRLCTHARLILAPATCCAVCTRRCRLLRQSLAHKCTCFTRNKPNAGHDAALAARGGITLSRSGRACVYMMRTKRAWCVGVPLANSDRMLATSLRACASACPLSLCAHLFILQNACTPWRPNTFGLRTRACKTPCSDGAQWKQQQQQQQACTLHMGTTAPHT
jgi:hypothetical protein